MRLRTPKILITVLLALLLTSCVADDAQSLVERYASRTSNAIEVDFDLQLLDTAQFYEPLADRRERIAQVPEIREGLLDLLDLRHCDLMRLVAERNTSLGRVALPSQRLIYELKLLPALEQCIEYIADDPEREALRDKLIELSKSKRSSYASLVFNAIYTSSEIEEQFSLGAPPLGAEQLGEISPLIEPLEKFELLAKLNGQTDWQTPAFTDQLETSYELFYRSDFGSRWISSMALLTQTLEQTSLALEQRLTGRPICFNGKQNNQSKILWTVFNKFYVQELQPYIALVERQGKQWSLLHTQILQHLEPVEQTALIAPFVNVDSNTGVWPRYLKARDRHTQAWQKVLEQCGLRPGNQDRLSYYERPQISKSLTGITS